MTTKTKNGKKATAATTKAKPAAKANKASVKAKVEKPVTKAPKAEVKADPLAAQQEKLTAVLAELAVGGKKAVAAKLLEKKCLGYVGDTDNCPVANYLQKFFKGRLVQVDGETASVEYTKGTVEVKLPKNVVNFIADFDAGKFDKLDVDSQVEDDEDTE